MVEGKASVWEVPGLRGEVGNTEGGGTRGEVAAGSTVDVAHTEGGGVVDVADSADVDVDADVGVDVVDVEDVVGAGYAFVVGASAGVQLEDELVREPQGLEQVLGVLVCPLLAPLVGSKAVLVHRYVLGIS